MLYITDFTFNDHIIESTDGYDNWAPDDPEYFNEWIAVLVGTRAGEGHLFQVNICTHRAIASLDNKKYIFPIPTWVSVSDLIERLDKFISEVLPENLNLDNDLDYGLAMENLGKHWLWEYANTIRS